jgi:hypothetical protein
MAAGLFVAPSLASADTQASHFIWTATSASISGDVTYINNLATNNEPGALLFVTPNYDPGGVGGTYDNTNVAVYYNAGRWGIFNENDSPMPVGASFNVFVVPAATSTAFTLTAASGNIAGDTTFIDSSVTNGKPTDVLQATQVWNGAFNNNAGGVYYDSAYHSGEWGVFNEGGAAMVAGTTYNVLVGTAGGGKAGVLKGNAKNIAIAGGAAVSLGTNATTSGDSNAFILDTPNYDPSGVCGCQYVNGTGVSYFPSQWNVFNESKTAMVPRDDFNLLFWNS